MQDRKRVHRIHSWGHAMDTWQFLDSCHGLDHGISVRIYSTSTTGRSRIDCGQVAAAIAGTAFKK